jgi:hypothetical protein
MKEIKDLVSTACGVLMLALPLLPESVKTQATPRVAPFAQKVYPDCEDVDITPCVTFDDDRWLMVFSYHPYRAEKIKEPKRYRGGFKLR